MRTRAACCTGSPGRTRTGAGRRPPPRAFWSMPWAVVAYCRKFPFRSLTATIEHCLVNYRVDPVLPALSGVQVLMIHGRRDQVAPYEHIRSLPEEFPNIRLVTLDDPGHHGFLTDTRRVRRLTESV